MVKGIPSNITHLVMLGILVALLLGLFASVKAEDTDLPRRGKIGSAVVFVEYSDLQCPACAYAHRIFEEEIYPEFADEVEFRHWPVALSYHEWAGAAEIVALCLREQEEADYWQATDFFFSNQESISVARFNEEIAPLFEKTKTDQKALADCRAGPEKKEFVEEKTRAAIAGGLEGTPSFRLGEKFLTGSRPASELRALLEDALAKSRRATRAVDSGASARRAGPPPRSRIQQVLRR